MYFYSAVLLQRSGVRLGSPELQSNLRRAIELDPQYADAYSLLGMSLMESGSADEGAQDLRRAMELSPRNEGYRLNHANALMMQQKVDDAEALLAAVAKSADPRVAVQATEDLKRIEDYKSMRSQMETRENASRPIVLHEAASNASGRPAGPEPAAVTTAAATSAPPPTAAAAKYLSGTLVAVDCSTPPSAVLSVVSGGKTWKMKVGDTDHAIIIGADKFSCSWSKQKVGLNYRPTGTTEGNVISLELE